MVMPVTAQVLFSRAMDVAPAYSKGAVGYASLLQVPLVSCSCSRCSVHLLRQKNDEFLPPYAARE